MCAIACHFARRSEACGVAVGCFAETIVVTARITKCTVHCLARVKVILVLLVAQVCDLLERFSR
jgi:hypothetical protein